MRSLRVIASLGALVLFGFLVWYLVGLPEIKVIAPLCSSGPDCGVSVSATPDPLVALGLMALCLYFSATAITGSPLSVNFGNGAGLSPMEPNVEEVKSPPTSAEQIDGVSETSSGADSDKDATVRASLDVWNALPPELQVAALEWAAEKHGITDPTSIQLGSKSIRRGTGSGNHAYYLTLDVEGRSVTLKLSKGGKGKRTPSARME